MGGEFGSNMMNNNDAFRLSRPKECSICKRIFIAPRDLIQHYNSSHHNNSPSGFAAFQSPPATTGPMPSSSRLFANQHQHQNQNQNWSAPNPAASYQARNHNFFSRGYLDAQGRFHRGPDPALRTNIVFTQYKRPRLMDFYPGESSSSSSSDGGRTLPLLRQLEMQMPEETARDSRRVWRGYIDLTLRLGLP